MGIFKKVQEKAAQKLDQLSTCPSCKHSTDVRGCTCARSDCACAFRR
jgi:hypothetical protein